LHTAANQIANQIANRTANRRFPGTYLFVDECHATGFLGATGRGTDEATGVRGRVDIINSTLGKALGGATGGLGSRGL
jgi:7-keto-8-aminopelargonate synthetase-like enzyme